MALIKTAFWILLFIVFYTYVFYGILLYILVKIKSLFKKKEASAGAYEPEVTLFVAAYNEKDYVDKKIANHFSLNYPQDKIKHVWVTDGSDDGTPEKLREYEGVEVYHKPERGGKIGAMNRGIKFVKTPVVIFSDGNTILGKDSVRHIVNLLKDPETGCVAGEKRIYDKDEDSAAGAGEGLYWKYESTLKKWDAELYSTVGAAGELFAIRTELYEKVEPDTLLDDFIISMRIVKKGYKIKYHPEAYAIETASANVQEEMKRKVRIAAGAFQAAFRLLPLLNPFRYGIFSFQYFSRKILRWMVVPFALPFLLIFNIWIVLQEGSWHNIYGILLMLQLLFYIIALAGWALKDKKIKAKFLFLPYYILMMNYASYLGLIRYLKGRQSVNWERAKRGQEP